MKKKIIISVLSVLCLFSLTGCNENTRNFGGTQIIELQKGEKLEEITWKDADLWYVTRPMRDDESPETHTFQEKSNMGIAQGKVIIKESR